MTALVLALRLDGAPGAAVMLSGIVGRLAHSRMADHVPWQGPSGSIVASAHRCQRLLSPAVVSLGFLRYIMYYLPVDAYPARTAGSDAAGMGSWRLIPLRLCTVGAHHFRCLHRYSGLRLLAGGLGTAVTAVITKHREPGFVLWQLSSTTLRSHPRIPKDNPPAVIMACHGCEESMEARTVKVVILR